MTARDPNFDAYVMQIHAVLDRLDYYRLLGVAPQDDVGKVKKAFHSIAAKFHPDRNRDAPDQVQKAIYDIFKRLNEAYRVLCDHERRQMYNQTLAEGQARLDTGIRKTAVPKTPEDTIRSRDARQFYRKALEALKDENLMQAELHVKVAHSREPGSKAIEELMKQIIAAKKEKKAKKKKKKG